MTLSSSGPLLVTGAASAPVGASGMVRGIR